MATKTTVRARHNKKENNSIVVSKKRGGDLLGQGAYGCVYSPPIPCESSPDWTNDGEVSKIMIAKNAKAEKQEADRIKNIDPFGKYFLPLVKMCETTQQLIDKHKGNGKVCKLTVRKPTQLIYKYKGVDMHKYLQGSDPMLLSEMVLHLLNFAKGIQVLQAAGLAHTDIKPDNVLLADVEENKKRMLLIDFGLLDKIVNMYDIENNYGKLIHNSPHYPPELLAFYMLNRNPRLEADDLYKNMMFTYKIDTKNPDPKKGFITYTDRNNIWDKSITEYKVKLTEFIAKLYTEKGGDLRNYFTENFAKKMDVFQFGFVLHEVVKLYNPEDVTYDVQPGDNERFEDLEAIVRDTYHPNPYARWDINKVISQLETITNKEYTTAKKQQSPSFPLTKSQSPSPPKKSPSPSPPKKSPSPSPPKKSPSPSPAKLPSKSLSVAKTSPATEPPSMAKDVFATVNEILFMDDKSLKTIVGMIITNKKK